MLNLNCRGRLITFERPLVMGILNVTGDSFYAGSRYSSEDDVLAGAGRMLEQGADMLDIGGQSTRPGARQLEPEEELQKVVGAVKAVRKKFPEIIISVDTFLSVVARAAIEAGADLINDISAGTLDPSLLDTVAELKVPYVLMHMKGSPRDMQTNPVYANVTMEVLDFLIRKLAECKSRGIHDIIVDPGIGFGKTQENNFTLLHDLELFRMLECPILLGVSRKSVIYHTLKTDPSDALNGTTVLNTIGLMNGASILRVHDVKQAVEAVKLFVTYRGNSTEYSAG